MNLYDFFIKPYETADILQITLEITGTLLGILSVFFSIKKNIWVYPTGIVSTVIYVYLLYIAGLIGDCIINIYYTVMSIYGWILWAKNSEDQIHVTVDWASKKEWILSFALFMVSLILITLIYYYKPFIENGFSIDKVTVGVHHLDWANWLDIFITSIFLVGMWLMARRRIESWIFWIVGDLASIPMYIYKGYGITSVQYLVFTIMAIVGFVAWKNSYTNKRTIEL
ncbi:nicotinamide riboside transporter PnuC [Chryseobacterium binzhouense]|uniref:nicotinamide riboside transporter PnuC n=1 Tax=Chryseobacterium binzhouense TaxID=2593646 RepID=UPI00289DDD60|nr:nicotinamide riboside transporter PnuC [Chryseobacterium binzhouense]